MKYHTPLFLIIPLSILLFSCEKEPLQPIPETVISDALPTPEINNSGVEVRVENTTGNDLSELKAEFTYFGSLEKGQVTDYTMVDSIANVPTISFYLDGELYKKGLEFCGFGISYFKEGRFTYTIDYIDPDNKGFHVLIQQD